MKFEQALKSIGRFSWPEDLTRADRVSRSVIAAMVVLSTAVLVLDIVGVGSSDNGTVANIVLAAIATLLIFLMTESDRGARLSADMDNLKDRTARSIEEMSDALGDSLSNLKESTDRAYLFGETLMRSVGARQIPGSEIRKQLTELLDATTSWHFRGGTARYQRAAVLPRLAAVTHTDVNVYMQLLDPRDETLCRVYAEYRRKSGDLNSDPKRAPDLIRCEILATIYAAAWYRRVNRVEPHVVLTQTFSPLRLDMGDGGMCITIAEASEPALFARSESWLYKSLRDEMRQAETTLPKLDFSHVRPESCPIKRADVSPQSIREALTAVEVVVPTTGQRSAFIENNLAASVDYEYIATRPFIEYGD